MDTIITRVNCPCCGSKDIRKVLVCKDYTVSAELFEVWECTYCTIRFTQDVPDQDSIAPYYQSDTYISHTDNQEKFINKIYKLAQNYTMNWKLNLVKASIGKGLPKGSLLDIGAGTGAFLNKASLSGWTVTGLEPNEGARQICRKKYNLSLQEAEKIVELSDESFDIVTMWHVLEHVHQLHENMSNIKRVLKSSGRVLIALPNYTSKDGKDYGAYWAAYDVPRHLYHFSPLAISKLAGQHNMEIESIHPMWLDAFYIALLSENYKSGKPKPVAAFLSGLKSNVNALKNKSACSSLVFVMRHKN
ncbi:MAG: class I SAM-dependent methyltransferase [Ferruginibacter sp.]